MILSAEESKKMTALTIEQLETIADVCGAEFAIENGKITEIEFDFTKKEVE